MRKPMVITVTVNVQNPDRVAALINAESRSNASLEAMVEGWARGGYAKNVMELEEKYGYAVDGKKLCRKCNRAFRPFRNEDTCNVC